MRSVSNANAQGTHLSESGEITKMHFYAKKRRSRCSQNLEIRFDALLFN